MAQHLGLVHSYSLCASVNLAELYATMILSPDVGLSLALVRFIRFNEAKGQDRSGNGFGGRLGLFLRHLLETLLVRAESHLVINQAVAPVSQYDDIREGLLL